MFQSIFNGLSSLQQHTKALNTVSHNVANANTEGYSKQRVNLESNGTKLQGNHYLGIGVHTKSVTRMEDNFLFNRLKTAHTEKAESFEEWNKLKEFKNQILDSSLDGENISDLIDSFFNSLQDVNNNPNSQSAIQNSLIKGENIKERTQALYQIFSENVDNMKDEKDLLIKESTELINEHEYISKEILKIEALNNNSYEQTYANDLKDKRDVIETRLSQLGNFKSYPNPDDNNILISEFNTNNGKIKGIDNTIGYLEKLMSKFKENIEPVLEQINFLKENKDEPNILLEWMYENKPQNKINDTFIEFSSHIDKIQNIHGSTETVLNTLQAQKDAKTKVNVDTEMTDMIRFQRAYQAAAKVIQTSDEMLQTLLDMKR